MNVISWLSERQFTGFDLLLGFAIGGGLFSILVSWSYMRAISYLTVFRRLLGQLADNESKNEEVLSHLQPAINARSLMSMVAKRAEGVKLSKLKKISRRSV